MHIREAVFSIRHVDVGLALYDGAAGTEPWHVRRATGAQREQTWQSGTATWYTERYINRMVILDYPWLSFKPQGCVVKPYPPRADRRRAGEHQSVAFRNANVALARAAASLTHLRSSPCCALLTAMA